MDTLKIATFAGGCFWCIEASFKKYQGIKKVLSGYAEGKEEYSTSSEVPADKTRHRESVQVFYHPKEITYQDLLEIFWRQIDPTDATGSFVDRGSHYTSAIFYHNEEQRRLAEISKEKMTHRFHKPLMTKILKLKKFYPAEEYHQDYHKKHNLKYKLYRFHSGRDHYRENVWGKDKEHNIFSSYEKIREDELRKRLTPLQFKVTQEDGTEPAFKNKYWNHTKEGIYVDLISGEPLFSSRDKFNSGTGWPSFTKPLESKNIVEKIDKKLGIIRTEVRSKNADAHLGHVFHDDPQPSEVRYCINSSALLFIPKEDLEKRGYGRYKKLFTS